MLQRLRRVDTDRLRARLEEASIVAAVTDSAEWREALTTGWLTASNGSGGDRGGRAQYAAEQLHAVRIATKKLRYALELIAGRAAGSRPSAREYAQARPGHPGQAARPAGHRAARGRGAGDAADAPGAHDGGLKVIAGSLADECRHLHGRYIKQVPALESSCSRPARNPSCRSWPGVSRRVR